MFGSGWPAPLSGLYVFTNRATISLLSSNDFLDKETMRICRDLLLVKRQSLPGEIHGHQRNYPRIFGAGWPAAAALLICVVFFACKRDAAAEARPGEPLAERRLVLAGEGEDGGFAYANDEAVRRAFTLDYREERPEPPHEAETLDAAAPAGASTAGAVEAVEIIPGLRKLSDYRTAYSVEGEAASLRLDPKLQGGFRDAAAERMLNPLVGAGPPTVVDWGPQEFLSSAVQRPSIYVVFSQPMVPLAALGEASASSPLVSIEPPLKGSFRWYGASFLSFEGDEPCMSQQTYTVSVSPEARSIYGIRIEGEISFTFETERL